MIVPLYFVFIRFSSCFLLSFSSSVCQAIDFKENNKLILVIVNIIDGKLPTCEGWFCFTKLVGYTGTHQDVWD